MALQQWACSGIKVDKASFEWQVKNFSLRSSAIGEVLQSPKFYSGIDKKEEWEIRMFLGGFNETRKDYIAVYLKRVTADVQNVLNVECEFSVVHPKHNTKFCNFFLNRQIKNKAEGTAVFLLRSIVTKNRDDYLLNDTLTIRCDLEVHANKSYFSRLDEVITKASSKVDQQRLGAHLKSFFNAMHLSDVTIIAGDEKFPAHKVVLCARSSVFARKFSDEAETENDEDEVEIENLTPKAVQGMLYYMYSDKIQDDSSILDLLVAAEMYDLEGLKLMCELALLRTLNENNAAEIFSHAHNHKAENLKAYAMDYIVAHESEIVRSDGFKELMNSCPSLVVEVYNARLADLTTIDTSEKD